jgi:5-methyltetrahydropteroyltriglutamate--homocysteine methyltransferase
MSTKVTDQLLPTTMIGSYPKPRWYQEYNVAGADLLEWWKLEKNFQAYRDATAACIKDQELAGLDIVTDGQMHFDEYGGAIALSSGIGTSGWGASARPSCPIRSPSRSKPAAKAPT